MQDSTTGQLRYLVHFGDGGSGMRDAPIEVGCELDDGGSLAADARRVAEA
jgi:hypothetical protein